MDARAGAVLDGGERAQRDLQRIAFVTRHFDELQGLRLVAVGTGILLGLVLWSSGPERFLQGPAFYIQLGGLWGFLAGVTCLDRYYRETAGSIKSRAGVRAIGAPWLAVSLAVQADMWVHIPMLVGGAPPAGMPSLAGAVLCVIGLWVILRDGPFRAHYAIAVVCGAVVVAISLSPSMLASPYLLDPGRAHALAGGYGLVAVTLIGLGLLDHCQLRLALARRPDTENEGAELGERCSTYGLARLTAGLLLGASAAVYGLVGFAHPSVLAAVLSSAALAAMSVHYWAAVRHVLGHRRVEQAPALRRSLPPDLITGVLFPLTIAAGSLLDILARGSGAPSIAALGFSCWRIWLLMRAAEGGRRYVPGVLAGLAGAVVYMGVSTPAEAAGWVGLALGLLGISLAIEGFADWRGQKAARAPIGARP